MLAVIFKAIFYAISATANIVSRVLLYTLAHFLALILHTFKVPGETSKGILERFADAIRWVLESALQLVIEILKAIVTNFLDAVKKGVVGLVSATSSTVGELLQSTRESLESAIQDVPEIIKGFSEMIVTMASDFWSNYLEASSIVKEKVD